MGNSIISGLLDWLDESVGGLIRLAYLAWGITAVWAYFGEGVMPFVVAFAIETHMYLTARRVRHAWQEKQWDTLKVNLAILGGLLAFSMLNQMQYLGATWHPPATPFALPGVWAYLVRAIVVPAAFMAAAFLAPVGSSLPAQVRAEAHRVAQATFRVARRQWRARLREMRKMNQDVTTALVQLVDDPDERRIIATIHEAMYPPTRPPTGPGTPTLTPIPDSAAKNTGMFPDVASVRSARRVPATRLKQLRKDSQHEAHRARGFDILTREPDLIVADLGKAIGCRTEIASAIRWDWQHQRREAVR